MNPSLRLNNFSWIVLNHLYAVVDDEILLEISHQARFNWPILAGDVRVKLRFEVFVMKEVNEFEYAFPDSVSLK